jgi:chorismate dehydratase
MLDDGCIAVTNETMTSVNLLKLILKEKGMTNKLVFIDSSNACELLKHCSHALVIGDEAIKARMLYRVVMDLGEEWYELTGYPMVFGISASLKEKDASEINRKLMESVEWGLENMDVVVEEAKKRFNLPSEFLEEYFKCLSYRMGSKEKKGLEIFEEMCRESGLL